MCVARNLKFYVSKSVQYSEPDRVRNWYVRKTRARSCAERKTRIQNRKKYFFWKKRDFRVYLLRVHLPHRVSPYKMINGFARYLFRYKLSAENALKLENSREVSWMRFCILCLCGPCASSVSVEGLKFDCRKEVKSKVLSIPRTTDVEDV